MNFVLNQFFKDQRKLYKNKQIKADQRLKKSDFLNSPPITDKNQININAS